MKRLFLILTILLFTTSSFAQTGSPVQFSGGGKFKGGTLTSNLTMSDGALIELATGTATVPSLRLRGDTDTYIWSPSANVWEIVGGGYRLFKIDESGRTYVGRGAGTGTPGANQGQCNTAIGYNTMSLGADQGQSNTSVGYGALRVPNAGVNNSCFGANSGLAGAGGTLQRCNLFGASTSHWGVGGNDVCAFGYQSFYNKACDRSVFVGNYSGADIYASDSVFVGHNSGNNASQASPVTNSIGIGKDVYTTASNQAVIGNASVTDFQLGQGGALGRFTSTMSTLPKPITHNVASNGYTIYQGNAAYSTVGEANVALPLNIAATSIAFDDGATGYIRAEVTGKNSTDSSCIHVELKAAYENFDDTLAFVGSPASITSQLNAATWSVVLSAADDDLSILATGTPGTIWQVKKLEIGGL